MQASTYILPCISNSQLFYSCFIIECIWSSRVLLNFTWADLVLIRKSIVLTFELDSAKLKMCLKSRSYEAPLLQFTVQQKRDRSTMDFNSDLIALLNQNQNFDSDISIMLQPCFQILKNHIWHSRTKPFSAVVPNLFLTFSLYLHPSWIYPILMLSLPAPLNSST